MIKFTRGAVRLALALALGTVGFAANAQTAFTDTYKGGTNSLCGSTFKMSGMEPSGSGKYPVYIHAVGTGEAYNSILAMAAVKEAASRGFVAATVEYSNSSFGTCSSIGAKTKCIFNGAKATSAIAKLCARSKADCSKGVTTGGLSQGSIVSVLSRDYDSRIVASFGQGTGTKYSIYNLSSCMANGKHKQTGDRIRLINGEQDIFVGPTASNVRTASQSITGLSCGSSANSCFRSNGSGWYIVKNSEVGDGAADHCFMLKGGCSGTSMENGYSTGSAAWQLKPSIAWLKNFTK